MKNKDVIQLSDHFTLPRLMRFCLPSIVMMVFTSIYGVVDGYFVSNFVGKTAFASVNLVMPFLMILGGVGFMIGTGGSALVAKCLGEKNEEQARRVFSMMIYLTFILGVTLSVLGIVFAEPVARFLGADEEMLANIKAGNYFLSRPFVMATKGEISEQNDLVQAWFDFVLGDEGQQVASEVGLITVK